MTDATAAPARSRRKGRFTIRTAAALFLFSAVTELLSIHSPAPIVGGVRQGVPAMAYHILYAGMFAVVGYALWVPRRWALRAVVAVGVVYTLDRGLLLLDTDTLLGYLRAQLAPVAGLGAAPPATDLLGLVRLALGLFIVGWWGFVAYLFVRRDYFVAAASQ